MLAQIPNQPVRGWIAQGQFDRNLHHALTVKSHPRRTVSLFQMAAGRQRCAPVEHSYVVQTEEASTKNVVAARVFLIDPPGEIQGQLLKHFLKMLEVAGAAELLFGLVDIARSPSMHGWIHISKV